MSEQVYNFGAGPAVLPRPVLEAAQAELLDYRGCGMSVMELSHRGDAFLEIAARAEASLRMLLGIPANYQVLFLSGGATSQFAMVPMNLLPRYRGGDYVITGEWGKKAAAEAARFGPVSIAASAEADNFHTVPDPASWQLGPESYVHYTANETVHGVEFPFVPEVGDRPLVSDMSSNILSAPLEVGRFGIIYAGAQKNIGPAGLTLVIVREDLVGHAPATVPTMFDYAVHAQHASLYNTPPTFAIYLAGLVFDWLHATGGLEAAAQRNREKADLLYAAIDRSGGFYRNPVAPRFRSRMNIPFTLADPALDAAFLAEAEQAGLHGLKGHRAVGGMRASLYNAMPREGAEALVAFMEEFAHRAGRKGA